jgi:hypothetical protein
MQLDFQGVILLMWSATVPLIYYGFYCDKTLQELYWSLVRSLPDHTVHTIVLTEFCFSPQCLP